MHSSQTNIRIVFSLYRVAFLLLFIKPQVQAAEWVFPDDDVFVFNHYSNEQGLPSSYVKSITQDQQGFIWMATRVSVCRFDGITFKVFPAYNQNGNLSDLRCNQILNFADSLLICRSNSGEYFSFDFKKECFSPFSKLNDLGSTQAIEAAQDGFWICRDKQVYHFNLKTGSLTNLKEKLGIGNFPNGLSFINIKVNNQQLIALTDKRMILWIDLSNFNIKSFDVPDLFSGSLIAHIYPDNNRNIWLNEETLGLCRIEVASGKISYFSSEQQGNQHISHNMAHTFSEDRQGRLWIGSEAGLLLWSPLTEQFTIRYEPSNTTGLNSDPIYCSYCDREGNMWLGSYFGGVNFWSGERKFFRNWNSGLSRWQLGGNVVSCLSEDHLGNLWVGLEDMGLNKVNTRTGEVSKYTSDTKP